MDQVHRGTLWYRDDDRKDYHVVYLLTNMGGGWWALVSLNSTGNTWNGKRELKHKPVELTADDWDKIRGSNDFTYIGKMPDIPLKPLLAQPWEDECRELMWMNRKVQAIQVMRKATGRGLKEAKAYCESYYPMSRDLDCRSRSDDTVRSPF